MGKRKLDTVIRIELTLIDWREVVAALENSSTERYQQAAETNNLRHARAWERESNWHERLATNIRDAMGGN